MILCYEQFRLLNLFFALPLALTTQRMSHLLFRCILYQGNDVIRGEYQTSYINLFRLGEDLTMTLQP